MSHKTNRKAEVIQWAVDRQIVANSTVLAQLVKTQEELDELKTAVKFGDLDEAIDGVGDVMVTLIIASHMAGLDYDLCLDYEFGLWSSWPPRLSCTTVEWRLKWAQKLLDQLVVAVADPSKHVGIGPLIARVAGATYAVASAVGANYQDCIEAAWQEIKDRKGKLNPDGIFVKDAT